MERRRIVAAESSEQALKRLKEMLLRLGYIVVGEATDGMTVLKLARSIQPDLVVLYAQLAGLDGFKVAKILEEEKVAPSLVITAHADTDLLNQGLDSFFISFIVKPIRAQQLFTAVEQTLANFERFKRLERQLKDLEKTLAERKAIERAKAILMNTQNLSENEAHRELQQLSMKKRKNMFEIATAIIAAHELNRH